MVLRSKRPVSGASRARMRKIAEHRIKKQMIGKGVLSELAKIIGPLVIKEGVKIGSALVQRKITGRKSAKAKSSGRKKKKGGALHPAGARAPARRRTAPMPRSLPHKVGKGKHQRKKRGGRKKM